MLEKVKFTARDGVLVFRKTLQETGEKSTDRLPEIRSAAITATGDRSILHDAARIPNGALQVSYRAGRLILYAILQAFAKLQTCSWRFWGTASPRPSSWKRGPPSCSQLQIP